MNDDLGDMVAQFLSDYNSMIKGYEKDYVDVDATLSVVNMHTGELRAVRE